LLVMARAGDNDEEPAAGAPPSGRIARTARVGGLVAGQSLRWAGVRTANRVRSPDRAAAANARRTSATVDEIVQQLAQMRGAAMKVGQMLSMVEFDGLEEEERERLQARLAELRDDVAPVPFRKLERLITGELGGPIARFFDAFDERAFAAASIGQVHRATTRDGDEVVVKVQYPGVAEAVETDLRNATLLLPLIKRLAPGLDGRALMAELRERIGEELDYELEAQNQRRIERRLRGHPFMRVARVRTDLSTRRVLVSAYLDGQRFEAVRSASEAVRDRYGEIVFRFFFGLLYRDGIALGDPHPGNYLLTADGSVAFLDFGLVRDVSQRHLAGERTIARAVRDKDAAALQAALVTTGYLPADRVPAADPAFMLRMMRSALRWYAVPGEYRFSPRDREARGRDREPPTEAERAAAKAQVNLLTVPPESVLIRRMHGVVAAVLDALRAGADWGAIAAEYLHGAPPATALGEAEAAFFTARAAAA
jgi:predicted unusual protein kinase regulating ubiquinone biosynthesis (AarF/ABC1/UbiB family)